MPTITQLANDLGLSRRTLSTWKREGQDMANLEELKARAALVNAGKQGNEALAAAKLRKLSAEADRAEIAVAREKGELIPCSEVDEAFIRIGATFRAAMMRLPADLPPMLEGLSCAAIQKVVSAKVDEVLSILSEEMAKPMGEE